VSDTDDHGFDAFWSYFRITTVLPVVLQVLLLWPFLKVLKRLLPAEWSISQTMAMVDAVWIKGRISILISFLFFNLILAVIALGKRKQTLMVWQPVIFLVCSVICYLLIGPAYNTPSVAPMFMVPLAEGYTVIFLFLGLTTIPSSIILFRYGKRVTRGAVLPHEKG